METFTRLISPEELDAARSRPDLRIVDCRFDLMQPSKGRREYLEGHIPGAVHADLDHDLSAPVTARSGRHPLPDSTAFAATVGRFGIANSSQVVVYDGGPGGLAARLWWMLRWLGHDAVAVLDGGYTAWCAAGKPVERGSAAPERAVFTPRERGGWVLGTAELEAGLRDGSAPALVDAREAARFRGDEEPIDPVAGHVPGAKNFPYVKNIDADGRWRTAAEIERDWRELFAGELPEDWAVMCGSGVTACHLALSAALAGLPWPRLYAGSWSEWIRDPGRPRSPSRHTGGC